MQQKDEQTEKFAKTLGQIIREIRQNSLQCSINQFANEYDLDVGNTCRIENGNIDVKLVTLWKISEALHIKLSGLITILEEKLGNDFHFYDM